MKRLPEDLERIRVEMVAEYLDVLNEVDEITAEDLKEYQGR